MRPSGSTSAIECDGEPRLAEALDRLRFAQHARAGRNQHVLSVVRVDGIGDETVDRRGRTAVQAVRQHRVDDRAFQDAMQRTRGRDRSGVRRGHLGTRRVHGARRGTGTGRSRGRRRSRRGRGVPGAYRRRRPHDGIGDIVDVGRRWHAPSPVGLPRDACDAGPGDVASRCPSGRRLMTTLLANRLSYSRRLALGLERIGRSRRGRCLLVHGPGHRGRARVVQTQRLLTCALVQDAQPVLIVAQPLGIRREWRAGDGRGRPARAGSG